MARTSPITDTTKLEVIATMLGRDIAEVASEGRTSFTAISRCSTTCCSTPSGSPDATSCSTCRSPCAAGEVLGLAGLLGSGRSETVKAIFGTQRLDRGT